MCHQEKLKDLCFTKRINKSHFNRYKRFHRTRTSLFVKLILTQIVPQLLSLCISSTENHGVIANNIQRSYLCFTMNHSNDVWAPLWPHSHIRLTIVCSYLQYQHIVVLLKFCAILIIFWCLKTLDKQPLSEITVNKAHLLFLKNKQKYRISGLG